MTNGYLEGQTFLSCPHTNNRFFFLLTTKYLIYIRKNMKKASRKSWICWNATWWRHFNISMKSRIDVRPACSWRVSVRFLSFPRAGMGMWDRVISHLNIQGKYWSVVWERLKPTSDLSILADWSALWDSLRGKYKSHVCYIQNLIIQASICSRAVMSFCKGFFFPLSL